MKNEKKNEKKNPKLHITVNFCVIDSETYYTCYEECFLLININAGNKRLLKKLVLAFFTKVNNKISNDYNTKFKFF